ncbi:MAG: PTS IIA-like nitrogen regulatory protein PtsN [Proteobacteria bacterium]|nr:PTS IIA-like nitrogen regulatory protein PtsN [Pseudomonadota bacterium]
MELADLIARDAILPAVKAGSKKQILQEIGARARDAYGLDTRLVVEGLLAREKLGSTAMGGGVAIPHARLKGLQSIAGLFARLERPADFEAVDGQGVDLLFVLLAPEESGADHLRALARGSRLLRDTELRKKLRETSEAGALYALITEPMASRAA